MDVVLTDPLEVLGQQDQRDLKVGLDNGKDGHMAEWSWGSVYCAIWLDMEEGLWMGQDEWVKTVRNRVGQYILGHVE